VRGARTAPAGDEPLSLEDGEDHVEEQRKRPAVADKRIERARREAREEHGADESRRTFGGA
jgi:hypothetical protein